MKRFIVLIFLFTGCATFTAESINVNYRMRQYNAPVKAVYPAAIAYCNEKGWALENTDREIGFIATGYRGIDQVTAIFTGQIRSKFSLNMREKTPGATTVMAVIQVEQYNGFGSWRPVGFTNETEAKTLYDKIFEGIQRNM